MKEMSARKKAHRAYLLTEHWKALRASAIERDGGKCARCSAASRLQVHHMVYRTPLEAGLLEDLETLCRGCHRKAHGLSTKIYRQFDVAAKALDVRFNMIDYGDAVPSDSEFESLILMAESKEDEREILALIRRKLFLRIILTSSWSWTSWLAKPPAVKRRVFDFAVKKLNKLKQTYVR